MNCPAEFLGPTTLRLTDPFGVGFTIGDDTLMLSEVSGDIEGPPNAWNAIAPYLYFYWGGPNTAATISFTTAAVTVGPANEAICERTVNI